MGNADDLGMKPEKNKKNKPRKNKKPQGKNK